VARGPSGTPGLRPPAQGPGSPDAGNTLTRNVTGGKQTLTWAHDGKLATDTTPAGTTSYVYDADGNLLLQKDPGQTTFYPFGGAEQIILNATTGAVTGTRFLALPGGGLAVRTGGGTSYSFEATDRHATSLLILDNTAANHGRIRLRRWQPRHRLRPHRALPDLPSRLQRRPALLPTPGLPQCGCYLSRLSVRKSGARNVHNRTDLG
jgi:YD repeat-containing protein